MVSVIRLSDFCSCKFLATNVTTKLAQILGNLFGNFENHHFQSKTKCLNFWQLLDNLSYYLFYHLITQFVVKAFIQSGTHAQQKIQLKLGSYGKNAIFTGSSFLSGLLPFQQTPASPSTLQPPTRPEQQSSFVKNCGLPFELSQGPVLQN